MHMKPEAMSPDHWQDFKDAVHRAICEIKAEIADPKHPREEQAKGDGVPVDSQALPVTAETVADLQRQITELKKGQAAH